MALRIRRALAAFSGALSLVLAPVATQVRADDSTSAPVVHVVQTGETLSQIADDAGVDLAAIIKLNGLDDANFVVAGQALKLPPGAHATSSTSAANAPPPNPPAVLRRYTVADGDTLWSIAQRLGTTTTQLVSANSLDTPDRLAVGAQLVVPDGASPAVTAPPTPPAAASVAGKRSLLVSYTVQPGETLNRIAHQFDVRPDAIVQANNLDDPNRLGVGVVLKVPLPGHEHVVAAGETLRDIAQQEKIDLGTLIDFNAIDDPELIHIGQVVLVPTAPNQQTAASSAAASAPAPPPTPTPTPAAAPAPAALAPAAPPPASAKPAARPVAPVVVVAPPRGAPTDGLAGAGLKLLGLPYVWGGSSPSGFDCSGFVWYVARQVGKPLSRGMFGEYNSGSHPGRDELKPGDLVFFQNTYSPGLSHNGIYIGNNQFVHAADETAGVTVSSLGTAYWSSHWFGATRLP